MNALEGLDEPKARQEHFAVNFKHLQRFAIVVLADDVLDADARALELALLHQILDLDARLPVLRRLLLLQHPQTLHRQLELRLEARRRRHRPMG